MKCSRCGIARGIEDFSRGQRWCKQCFREYARLRRQAFPELQMKYNLKHQKKYPEASAARTSRWRFNHPEKSRAASTVRKARKAGVLHIPFTPAQLRDRFSMFSGCWMCGSPADSQDHVKPLSKGGAHILANLRPACRRCNSSKGAKWPLEDSFASCSKQGSGAA